MTQPDDKKQPETESGVNVSDNEVLEARLRATLYRQDCPETLVLGEYRLGVLAGAEQEAVDAHLGDCPHCQAELARLAEFMAADLFAPIAPAQTRPVWQEEDGFQWRLAEAGRVLIELAAEAIEKAKRNLEQGFQAPANPLAFSGVRSGASKLYEIALEQGVDDFEAIITLETGWQEPDHCDVVVDVNIPSRGGWPNLAGVKVSLILEETKLVTQATNPFGQTVFRQIPTAQLNQLRLEIAPQQ